MAISRVNVPITAVVDLTSFVNIAAANTLYETMVTLSPGTYTITCPSVNVTNVQFWNEATLLVEGVTASGTVTVTLASAATSIRFWTLSGTNILVGFKKTGETLSNAFSGTYTTHTSDATVTTSGTFLFTIVGGGGGGGGRNGFNGNNPYGGGGGGSGGLQNVGPVAVTNTYDVSIGSAGTGGSTGGVPGNAGGATTLTIADGSTYTVNGGGGGGSSNTADINVGSPGGTPGGGIGARGGTNVFQAAGASTAMSPTYVGAGNVLGTTGGGGGGLSSNLVPNGAGSGIGTGGRGGQGNNGGLSATGFGGGGGGAGTNTGAGGGAGSAGIIYAVKIA